MYSLIVNVYNLHYISNVEIIDLRFLFYSIITRSWQYMNLIKVLNRKQEMRQDKILKQISDILLLIQKKIHSLHKCFL